MLASHQPDLFAQWNSILDHMATPRDSDSSDSEDEFDSGKLLSMQQIQHHLHHADKKKKKLEFSISQHLTQSSTPAYTGDDLWRSPHPARPETHHPAEDTGLQPPAAAAADVAHLPPEGHPPGDHHPANPGTGTIADLVKEMSLQRQQNTDQMERMFQLMASSQNARNTVEF
jgi:hypothetical protein